MRILYSHRIQSRDGQAVHVEELIRALRAAGHEVLVVGPGFYEEAEFGGESKLIAVARKLLPGALWELAELGYAGLAYIKLLRAYRQFRPDFIYERCNLYHLAGSLLARWHGAVMLLEVNSPLAAERQKHGGLKLFRLAQWLEQFTWGSAAMVLPVTAVLGDSVAAAGVARDKIQVVPNGINLASFPDVRAEKPEGAPITLGFVGFVRPWHGLDLVIAGMAAEPRAVELVVVGDGPVRADLQAQAAELGLGDRVRFTGIVPPEQVAEIVAGFDIALQPMATPYASPLKIFDYMAAGAAIVAPDQPNIREILGHLRNAVLFDPAEPAMMWSAVSWLIEDAALRVKLGAAARADLVACDYTWDGNAGRVVGAATKVLAARAG